MAEGEKTSIMVDDVFQRAAFMALGLSVSGIPPLSVPVGCVEAFGREGHSAAWQAGHEVDGYRPHPCRQASRAIFE